MSTTSQYVVSTVAVRRGERVSPWQSLHKVYNYILLTYVWCFHSYSKRTHLCLCLLPSYTHFSVNIMALHCTHWVMPTRSTPTKSTPTLTRSTSHEVNSHQINFPQDQLLMKVDNKMWQCLSQCWRYSLINHYRISIIKVELVNNFSISIASSYVSSMTQFIMVEKLCFLRAIRTILKLMLCSLLE